MLKRGLAASDAGLISWIRHTLESNSSETIKTKDIRVQLLNENGNPLMSWRFNNTWPMKWAIANSTSSETEIMIESLEFAYSYFERINEK